MHVLASLGSIGIWLSRRPRAVKASSASKAPRLDKVSTDDLIAEGEGGVSLALKEDDCMTAEAGTREVNTARVALLYSLPCHLLRSMLHTLSTRDKPTDIP